MIFAVLSSVKMIYFILPLLVQSLDKKNDYYRQNKKIYYGIDSETCPNEFMTRVHKVTSKWENLVQNITLTPEFNSEKMYLIDKDFNNVAIFIECNTEPKRCYDSWAFGSELFCSNISSITDNFIEVNMLQLFAIKLFLYPDENPDYDPESFFVTKSTKFSKKDKLDWDLHYPLNRSFVFPKPVSVPPENDFTKKSDAFPNSISSFLYFFVFLFI